MAAAAEEAMVVGSVSKRGLTTREKKLPTRKGSAPREEKLQTGGTFPYCKNIPKVCTITSFGLQKPFP
jgi:hypothetical protein